MSGKAVTQAVDTAGRYALGVSEVIGEAPAALLLVMKQNSQALDELTRAAGLISIGPPRCDWGVVELLGVRDASR